MSQLLPQYDVVVIGGGINGAGIARDAAMRGLSVLLLEQDDFGSGTSSWSSRLIHGGLRYLEYGEIPLVFESLHERRRLRRIAPHLVKRLRLKVPIYEGGRRGMLLLRLGMLLYDLLSIGKSVPHHRMLSREQFLQQEPGVRADRLLGGASYFDAQVTFAERLVIENVIAAAEAGASVRNYSPVIGINVADRRVKSIQFLDAVNGSEHEVRAAMIVNAAGPWVDSVLRVVNRKMPRLMGGTKGSHIIIGKFRNAPADAFYVEATTDGRPYFIIPWNHQYLVGTTDIRFSGDPANVQASDKEIDYLLEETNQVFPDAALTRDDVHYAYAGIRPLPFRAKGPESAITRRHIIKKHGRIAKGLVSVVGGKLTTYRNLSEQVVDFAARKSGKTLKPCTTRQVILPGGRDLELARRRVASVEPLSAKGKARLLAIYGGRSSRIIDLSSSLTNVSLCMDDECTILTAEVLYNLREEHARTLTDIVFRRMMIGLDADQGKPFIDAITTLAAKESGWSRSRTAEEIAALNAHTARLNPKQV